MFSVRFTVLPVAVLYDDHWPSSKSITYLPVDDSDADPLECCASNFREPVHGSMRYMSELPGFHIDSTEYGTPVDERPMRASSDSWTFVIVSSASFTSFFVVRL